jgi:hypothetical protein
MELWENDTNFSLGGRARGTSFVHTVTPNEH